MNATRLGPHRYKPGDVIGRWTVIRHASPVQRVHGHRGADEHRVHCHRVTVRCVCGETAEVLEKYIAKGESRGCTRMACVRRERIREAMSRDEGLVAHAREMRRLADEAEADAAHAEVRIRQAREDIDRCTSSLDSRRWRPA